MLKTIHLYSMVFLMKSYQNTLFSFPITESKFGGSNLKSHPKTSRPVSKKHPMHVVLKSDLARGRHSFLLRARRIENHIYQQAKKHGVKVLNYVNVGNHLHLVLQLGHRRALVGFLRSLCGVIAKEFRAQAKKLGNSLTEFNNFWSGRPFSRVIRGFIDLRGTQKYLFLNELEALGVTKERGRALLGEIRKFIESLTSGSAKVPQY